MSNNIVLNTLLGDIYINNTSRLMIAKQMNVYTATEKQMLSQHGWRCTIVWSTQYLGEIKLSSLSSTGNPFSLSLITHLVKLKLIMLRNLHTEITSMRNLRTNIIL
jgi:hypothetical protein